VIQSRVLQATHDLQAILDHRIPHDRLILFHHHVLMIALLFPLDLLLLLLQLSHRHVLLLACLDL
jgi:hypothetical protein